MSKLILVALLALGLSVTAGCTAVIDAATPGLKVENDSLDGSLRIYQPPVSISGISGPRHKLAFEWSEKYPDVVYVTVGVYGTLPIRRAMFKVDGEVLQSPGYAHEKIDFAGRNNIEGYTTQTFRLPINDFVRIANGDVVKMKTTHMGTRVVSGFGESVEGTGIFNRKFQLFLDELAAQGAL